MFLDGIETFKRVRLEVFDKTNFWDTLMNNYGYLAQEQPWLVCDHGYLASVNNRGNIACE